MKTSKGFTLVEIVMAVVLIGVIFAAAFVFLRGGLHSADVASARAEEGSTAQLAVSGIESFIDNAAYPGDLFKIDEPVLEASSHRFTFVSNTRNPGETGPEDVITVASSNGTITVVDGNGEDLMLPVSEAEIAFSYTDGMGNATVDPSFVRTVNFTITMASGAECSGYSTPYNLELAGLSPEEYRDIYAESDGHMERWTNYKFEEDFENFPGYVFEDDMEGAYIWQPILEEDFETAASWASNWETWTSDPGFGRVQRLNDASVSWEASNCLLLDCWGTGVSTNMGIWTVDLSSYTGTNLRLRFHWREATDELDYEDGVFLPVFTAGDTTVIDLENFSGFGNGNNRGWTYWTNDYGRIVVTDDYPTDGNYLNMDSRRNGGANQCRVMNTYDLSAYSGNSNVWLRYDFTDRDDENNAGDFIGLMSGDIQGDPVAQVSLNPGSYPDGSWLTREVDLDELAPAGYDWSDFRIVFAQEDNYPTTSSTATDGISIDNVRVVQQAANYWDLSNRMIQAPSSFQAWEEATVDLSAQAAAAGIPFSSDFKIGFSATNRHPYSIDGILFDAIFIDARSFGMAGWTHGVWPGNTVDEWEAVNNSSDAYRGDWYYSVGGTGNYSSTPTHAWLQSPDIDLTSFNPGDRVAVAFFHKYDFGNAGGGCNVLISDDNGATWNLIAPYFGYYTNAVASLGDQAGWTGHNYGWGSTGPGSYDFAVFDITDYAGETVQIRFNYGTAGESHGGWQVDYCRSRAGADWPQVDTNGGGFDWFAYSNSGYPDPSSTPNGSLWAGNDMSLSGSWDREYENNQNNYLLSPPVWFNDDSGSGVYSYIEFIGCPRTESYYDHAYLEIAPFSEVAPASWFELCKVDGSSSSFTTFRYRLDNLPAGIVWPSNHTIVFRWRMESDYSVTAGGWNLDNIRCYTTSTWLPDMTDGVVVTDGENPGGSGEPAEDKPFAPSGAPYHGQPRVAPLFSQDPQSLLEGN